MKKIALIIILIFGIKMYSQNSLYFKKIDTIYIMTNLKLPNNPFIRKNYFKSNNKKGIKIIYNLLDTTQLNKRKKHYSYLGNINGSVGATHSCFGCFGLYFLHYSTKSNRSISKLQKDPFYKTIYRRTLNKNNPTLKDTLKHDQLTFSRFRTLNSGTVLMLSKKELKNKRVINFNGSTKAYKELLKLAREPYYFYILDKEYSRTKYGRINKKKRGVIEINYFIFNEVFFATRPLKHNER